MFSYLALGAVTGDNILAVERSCVQSIQVCYYNMDTIFLFNPSLDFLSHHPIN